MTDEFDSRYHSEMRRNKAARSLKKLKIKNFRRDCKTDEEDFMKLTSQLERLSCLAHEEDQSNHALCTALWSAVEECPWLLHTMAKSGTEGDYPTAVEALTNSIQNNNKFIGLTVMLTVVITEITAVGARILL